MTHLLYASDEMFSSTQLVRKSKDIFDKLTSRKIEKAVILRDGKPNFMLLEFHEYEKIMREYQELKSIKSNNIQTIIRNEEVIPEEELIEQKEDQIELKLDFSDILNDEIDVEDELISESDLSNKEEIAQAELAKALAQIDSLDLDPDLKNEAREKLKENSPAQIKEFWN